MSTHDQNLAHAFDTQAAKFERALVQSDPARLDRLVRFAGLPPASYVFDAGCGPGLVSAALLAAGHRVFGVDLSAEMIARARQRCAPFGQAGDFEQQSVFDPRIHGPFDACISRLVLHHMPDPHHFVWRQAGLLRPGGVLVLGDHTTDPFTDRARWHQAIERGRDRTHTSNLSPGAMLDLLAGAGLVDLSYTEEAFTLDFDEWFDRGSPSLPKEEVRRLVLSGQQARGFTATPLPSGAVRIDCQLGTARGIKASGAC
ncbi:methyltransferase [Planctomycetaceae bacterium SCGC AG-212-F19]|nr:methyltransferase [Planctomycetaceae bacterium SCGC AG-212-F19]